jgi:2-keto-4-pentenoate hydratase
MAVMTAVWDDPRVSAGMRAQLGLRDRRLAAGAKALGWKVAFSAPEAMERLGIAAPLVGFLTDRSIAASGSDYSLDGWTKPALEPEIAIHMGADLRAGASEAEAEDAIAGLGAAIELADVDRPLDDLEAVIATNIFQRGVILGPLDISRARGDATGIAVRIERDGEEIAAEDDPGAVVGRPVDVARHVADLLAACGAALRAGDVIISGSVVPLIWVAPGEHVAYRSTALGELDVRFTGTLAESAPAARAH